MWPQCAPSVHTQYFLNFPKKVTSKCLSHPSVVTFKIYWVMWLQCAGLACFLHIHNILSPYNHILPEWLKENILTMWSESTESGKLKKTCWAYFKQTEHIQYIVISLKIYLVRSVCSKYAQHVFLISQTQYFLITLWVYFLWATQVKCDYMDSVYYECAKNMPIQHIMITWLSIFWM